MLKLDEKNVNLMTYFKFVRMIPVFNKFSCPFVLPSYKVTVVFPRFSVKQVNIYIKWNNKYIKILSQNSSDAVLFFSIQWFSFIIYVKVKLKLKK